MNGGAGLRVSGFFATFAQIYDYESLRHNLSPDKGGHARPR